jgi:hypothetical protein
VSDALLTVLKLCFLALLYLFLLRVVRVTVLELRTPVIAAAPVAAPAPERRERGRYRLELLEPLSRQGESVTLDDEVTVGRGGGCTIVLSDDTFVSQVHARLFLRDNKLWLEDLGSTNGTFHNGDRVTGPPIRLKRGDRVQFGQTVAEVVR